MRPDKTRSLQTTFPTAMSEANEKTIPSPVEDSDDLRKLYHQVLQQRSVAEQELFVEGLDYTKHEEGKVIRTLDARLFTAVLFSTFVLNIVSTPPPSPSSPLTSGSHQHLQCHFRGLTRRSRVHHQHGQYGKVSYNRSPLTCSQVYAVIFTLTTFSGAILGKLIGPQRYM